MRNSDELRNRVEQVRQSISRPGAHRAPAGRERPPDRHHRAIGGRTNPRKLVRVRRPLLRQLVRIWKCDRSGQWWPDGKRGLSVAHLGAA